MADERPTAMVKWIISCFVFILLAILEYAWIIKHMYSKGGQNDLESQDDNMPKQKTWLRKVDNYMEIVFPIVFVIFTAMFWVYTAVTRQ